MKAEDIYRGRKPKLREPQSGTQVLRQPTKQRGEKNTSAEPVRGRFDLSDGWLRGQSGELHPFYHRSKRSR